MQPRHYPPVAANLAFSWLAAIVLTPPPLLLWWQCLQQPDGYLLVAALLASVLCWRLLAGGAGRALQIDYRGRLSLDFGQGLQACSLLDSSSAWSWLLCLRLRDEQGGSHAVLVWRDAVPAETHRALRVYIAWSRQQDAGQNTEQKDY